ncbi:MAG: 6-carboxyhexanoate--CoA ligase [Desulfuromonadales bacterium]|nr:6-carboxyhexanoate--CoA ligase [Desulfuromonadales bacterium]MDT8423198.1 6-carboxyhexanoate--CoA ligase [Desulfuromonadales bacterium]
MTPCDKDLLYSIRMRAERGGSHLSGAERIGSALDVERMAAALARRAMTHPRGCAESIRITVEALTGEPQCARLPELTTLTVSDYRHGRELAGRCLERCGVAPPVVARAIDLLSAGAAPGGVSMRGALLLDATTGERLDPDPARGVRVSRMDLTALAASELAHQLRTVGLDNPHVREALILAGKVLLTPGIIAELCWSDDPDYVAGYVAAAAIGYVRFPQLKPAGEECGGRVFFVDRAHFELAAAIEFLQRTPVLFDRVGLIRSPRLWEEWI